MSLEDQRCCVETVLTEEEAKKQETEIPPVFILDIPYEVASLYAVLCCRKLGGPGHEIDGIIPEYKLTFLGGDIILL